MYNTSEAVPRFYTKEAMNMADKIDVKLVLELRQANMSQRAIAASRHISTKSVAIAAYFNKVCGGGMEESGYPRYQLRRRCGQE